MTVKELTEKLLKMPEDANVKIIDYDSLWQTGRLNVEEVIEEQYEDEVVITIF